MQTGFPQRPGDKRAMNIWRIILAIILAVSLVGCLGHDLFLNNNSISDFSDPNHEMQFSPSFAAGFILLLCSYAAVRRLLRRQSAVGDDAIQECFCGWFSSSYNGAGLCC
jgi:hypothetical protein